MSQPSIVVTLKREREVKHSVLYKHEDGSNAYIKKDRLTTPYPETVIIIIPPAE